MSNADLQQKLTAWVGDHSDAPSAFVKRLRDALGSPQEQKLWAFIDIRREFESLLVDPEDLASSSSHTARRAFVQSVLPILYVLPILVTWFELGWAVNSFRSTVRLKPREDVDFLAVWSDVYGTHAGLGFVGAAIAIVVLVSLIIVANGYNSFATRKIKGIATTRLEELNPLLLDAQLMLVKSRAVTPEEMSDSLTTAAGALQDALAEVAGVLPRFETISIRLDDVVSGLATASNNLDSTSRVIGAAADSLNDLPDRATPLIRALGEAPEALRDMLKAFARTSEEASRINRSIVDAGAKLTDEYDRVAGAISAVGRQLSDLVRQVEGVAAAASIAQDLAQSLESATPVALIFRDGTEQIHGAIEALGQMVKELKHAADQYKAVNDEHGRQN